MKLVDIWLLQAILRQTLRIALLAFATEGFLVSCAIAIFFLHLDIYGRMISDQVLANAAIPSEREMPTTAGQIPYSSADVEVVGGRGEGLSCSLPPRLAKLAFPTIEGRAPIGLEMRQACAAHDFCYRHGAATYGYTQADCDFLLQEQAFRLCFFIERLENGAIDKAARSKCIRDARLVTFGVRLGGSDSFRSLSPETLPKGFYGQVSVDDDDVDDRASTYFEYDPYPVRSLSHAIFRIADAPDSGGAQTRRKSVYKFSMRPSGIFVSFASDAGELTLKAIIPGDPSYIVSAPLVIETQHGAHKEDWFVWWQRRGTSLTGGRILAIAPGRATEDDWKCLYLLGMPQIMRNGKEPCHAKSTAVTIAEVGDKERVDDPGFLQILPAHSSQVTFDTLRLMAILTRDCVVDGVAGPCIRNMAINTASGETIQPQASSRIIDQLSEEVPARPINETSHYRNFATRPFVLRPPTQGEPILAWTRRDAEYESTAFMRRIGNAGRTNQTYTGYSRGSVWLKSIDEADEPLFAIGRTGEQTLLVSLRRKGAQSAAGIEVLRWHLPDLRRDDRPPTPEIATEASSCDLGLDATWLARPPISFPSRTGGAIIFLSKVSKLEDGGFALQLAIFTIGADGRCAAAVRKGPIVPLKRLVPAATLDDTREEESKLNQKRIEFVRQTPILVGDLENDGQLDVIFPGAGLKPTVMNIATIDESLIAEMQTE